MSILKAKFDLLTDRDLDSYNELISDPLVIIEKTSLSYRSKLTPGFGDDEDEFEEFLDFVVSYSQGREKYVDNLFRKAVLLTSRGYGTPSHDRYVKFIESDEIDLISTKETNSEWLMYVLVEYTDLNDMVNKEAGENLRSLIHEGIIFDAESGSFMSD